MAVSTAGAAADARDVDLVVIVVECPFVMAALCSLACCCRSLSLLFSLVRCCCAVLNERCDAVMGECWALLRVVRGGGGVVWRHWIIETISKRHVYRTQAANMRRVFETHF